MNIHHIKEHPTFYAEGFNAQRVRKLRSISTHLAAIVITAAICLTAAYLHYGSCYITDAGIAEDMQGRDTN